MPTPLTVISSLCTPSIFLTSYAARVVRADLACGPDCQRQIKLLDVRQMFNTSTVFKVFWAGCF